MIDIPSFEREEKQRLKEKNPKWTDEKIQSKVDDNIDYLMRTGKLTKALKDCKNKKEYNKQWTVADIRKGNGF